MLLSIVLGSDQLCNIKDTCLKHCQVMRSSLLSNSPGAERRGKLTACQTFFCKDTPLGGELAQAPRWVEELALLVIGCSLIQRL